MKNIRILLLTVFAAAASFTASYGQGEFAIGVKGGLNFANVDGTSANAAYNSRTGYHIGAFTLFKFSKIGIQPELIFSQQGMKVRVNSSDFDSNFSYLNIPIILKLYLAGGFNLQAGPQFGFLMSAKGINGLDLAGNPTTGDIKNSFKSSDVSIGLGAGFDFPFGMNLDARYNMGMTNINNTSNPSTVKNQVFQISVGFKLIKFGK